MDSLKDLESHTAKTNKHLSDNSLLEVSLHNGPKAFVVTNPSKALYGLVTGHRGIMAPSGADQSKVPFSQRKPVVFLRFLIVGVPFHSQYLNNDDDEPVSEDLKGTELWSSSDLQTAVFNTENGEIMHTNIVGVALILRKL